MAERQSFGFEYQKDYCSKNSLEETKDYTSKYDAFVDGMGCQIKTYKNNGELMMANPFRYMECDEDFYLVVANRDDNNAVLSERKFLIKNDSLKAFMSEQNFEERCEYVKDVLDSVSNDRSDDDLFKELMEKEKQARKNSIVNIQAKRDHKSQKRVQWSIPNRHIEEFYSYFEEVL